MNTNVFELKRIGNSSKIPINLISNNRLHKSMLHVEFFRSFYIFHAACDFVIRSIIFFFISFPAPPPIGKPRKQPKVPEDNTVPRQHGCVASASGVDLSALFSITLVLTTEYSVVWVWKYCWYSIHV